MSKQNMGFLDRILEPITTTNFVEEYFGKRPLYVRGTPSKFDNIMTPDAFIHGLDRVSEIRCVFDELKQATIGPVDIKEMFEVGATICVTGLELAHQQLQVAANRIEEEIGFLGKVDFRAYLSPPGKGFDFHYDARIATSLQIDGTKTWWYSTEPETVFPTKNSSRENMSAVRKAVSRFKIKKKVLHPGDLLCLPAGVWHRAEAGAGGSLALNMAFNHSGATVLDILLQQVRDRLVDCANGRQPFLLGDQSSKSEVLSKRWDDCLRGVEDALHGLSTNASVVEIGRNILKKRKDHE